jgi:hypothetical protein
MVQSSIGKGDGVEFMALIYSDESRWDVLGGDERDAIMERYIAFSREAREAGVIVAGDELGPTRHATTVRVRDGAIGVTDGPYAEAKEALGGYFILECPTIDDAVAWAARIPSADVGAVEVRPVHVDTEES